MSIFSIDVDVNKSFRSDELDIRDAKVQLNQVEYHDGDEEHIEADSVVYL